MESDTEMLRRFAENGDESAFRGIVDRHAAMVLGVALRRSGNRSVAEDVTQAVFTILARKASSLTHGELAGWLHRAAFIEARNAYRKEARRSRMLSEMTAGMNDPAPAPEVDWQAVRPHIDELLGKLSSQDRELVVLRYFEQRSYPEISRTTGAKEDSIRKRVDRALERLAGLLGRRGVRVQGASLGVLLAGQVLCPAPASAAVISSTALSAAGSGAAGSALLFSSFLLMTTSTKLMIAAAALVIIALPTVYVVTRSDQATKERGSVQALPETSDPAVAAKPELESTRTDPQSQGLAQAEEESLDLSALFTDDFFFKMTISSVEEDSAAQFNKLTARLKLTPEQQAALRGQLDRRNDAAAKTLREAEELGLVNSEEARKKNATKLKEIVNKHYAEPRLDAFLESLLTPEQFADHVRIDREQRDESARDQAQALLDTITKHVDLSAEEQQVSFDKLHRQLVSIPADEVDPVVLFDGTIQVELNHIESLLTAEQMAIFREGIAEEGRRVGEALNRAREERQARGEE